MTQERTPPTVEVNVSVCVTLPGGVPLVVTSDKPPPKIGRFDDGPIILDIPAADASGLRTAQVWYDSCTNASYICAKGRLVNSACCVLAEVYPASATLGINPPPPFGDAALRSALVDTTDTHYPWQFTKLHNNLLPVPAGGSGSGSNGYILAVWVKFDGASSYTFQPFGFVGVNSTHTDCDTPPGPAPMLAAPGVPAHTAPPAVDHPSLTAVLREKTGRFAALPEHASFVWTACQGAWVWVPPQAQAGTFTLRPHLDSFLLECTASDPPFVAPRPGGVVKPLQLTFEVTAPSAKHGRPDHAVLEVRQAGGPPHGAAH